MPSKSGTKAYRRFHFMITTQIQFCEPLTFHEISDKNAQRSKLELKELTPKALGSQEGTWAPLGYKELDCIALDPAHYPHTPFYFLFFEKLTIIQFVRGSSTCQTIESCSLLPRISFIWMIENLLFFCAIKSQLENEFNWSIYIYIENVNG